MPGKIGFYAAELGVRHPLLCIGAVAAVTVDSDRKRGRIFERVGDPYYRGVNGFDTDESCFFFWRF